MNTCSINNCKREKFNKEACIFHCKKNDWYEEQTSKNGIRVKHWDTKLVERFWNDFYLHIKENKDCTNFIFPEFEYYVDVNANDVIHKWHLSDFQLLKLDFSKSTFVSGLYINNSKLKNCKFNQCNFTYLHIFASEIDNCSFHGSRFESASLDGNTIYKTNFQWLHTDDMSFMYSKIKESNFNNSYFKTLNLEHAVVSDSSFQNITVLSGNIHTFRILKSYYQGIADNINANGYYAKEMQEYCKDIVYSPFYNFKNIVRNIRAYFKYDNDKTKRLEHIHNSIKEFFWSVKTFFSDGLLLIWNFLVSNYGQNWLLPLIWLFISSYIIYEKVHSNIIFDINEFSMFMNPFIKNTEKYNEFYALWMLHKLLESIFIYQFIVAVRRRLNR